MMPVVYGDLLPPVVVPHHCLLFYYLHITVTNSHWEGRKCLQAERRKDWREGRRGGNSTCLYSPNSDTPVPSHYHSPPPVLICCVVWWRVLPFSASCLYCSIYAVFPPLTCSLCPISILPHLQEEGVGKFREGRYAYANTLPALLHSGNFVTIFWEGRKEKLPTIYMEGKEVENYRPFAFDACHSLGGGLTCAPVYPTPAFTFYWGGKEEFAFCYYSHTQPSLCCPIPCREGKGECLHL